ncbi:MAG TPA: AI-2E family transporter [Micromonosporaceae bacterium]|nr:AI-2E family transporter [Micromonosporaceae bacterium]
MSAEQRVDDPDNGSSRGMGAAAVPTGTVFRWAVAATLGVLIVAATVLALYTVRSVLVQVVVALFVAVSLDPAVRWLINRGVRRSVAVTVIFLLALGGLAGFIWSIAPPLVSQAVSLAERLPSYVSQLSERSDAYRGFADRYGLTDRLTSWAAGLPAKIGPQALGFVQGFLGAVLNLLLVVVLTIYFMLDLPRLRRGLVRAFPRDRRPHVAQAVNVVVDKVGAYMIGNLVISLVAGVSTFICLTVVGVPFALPLALFVALTDLIPLVGATMGAVGVVGVTLFTVDLWPDVVVVAIFFLAYQQIENYLVAPRVMRNAVNLSSITVLLAALMGGTVLGVVGAIMVIPMVAAVKVLMTPRMEALNQAPPGHPDPPAVPPVSPAPVPPPTAA